MDDVLALTKIPELVERYKDEAALGIPVDNQFQQNERSKLLLWFNNIGSSNHGASGQAETALSSRAYKLLKSYIENPTIKSPFDALVDMSRVNALGLSPDCIGLWLKNSKLSDTNAVREAAYRAIFVNTLGMTGRIALDTVMSFFDDSNKTSTNAHGSGNGKKDKMRGWTKYTEVHEGMTTMDIKQLCAIYLNSHLNKKEITNVIEERRETVERDLQDALSAPVFTAEKLLVETCYQVTEPILFQHYFETAIARGRSLPQIPARKLPLLLRGKNVQLVGSETR